MTITIELPNELHQQAEAYAASKNQNLETLFVSFLQDSLADVTESQDAANRHSESNGSQVAVETDSEAEVWGQVFDEVMEEYANVWEKLAQL